MSNKVSFNTLDRACYNDVRELVKAANARSAIATAMREADKIWALGERYEQTEAANLWIRDQRGSASEFLEYCLAEQRRAERDSYINRCIGRVG